MDLLKQGNTLPRRTEQIQRHAQQAIAGGAVGAAVVHTAGSVALAQVATIAATGWRRLRR